MQLELDHKVTTLPARILREWLLDARERLLASASDLSDAQLEVPHRPEVNPLRWELGHVAYFHEVMVLDHLNELEGVGFAPDVHLAGLYDSMEVAHEERWDIGLLSRPRTLAYLERTLDLTLDWLDRTPEPGPRETYLVLLGIVHEDMHTEAITYTRQSLGYAAPPLRTGSALAPDTRGSRRRFARGSVHYPAGESIVGAAPDALFAFDNEGGPHTVWLDEFSLDTHPVSFGMFRDFVDDGGYLRAELWSEAGRAWLERSNRRHPGYWRKQDGAWEHRHFDTWKPLPEEAPVIHVNHHEAEAYCSWTGRRLPTEAEWERAARGAGGERRYAWGNEIPEPGKVHLDGCYPGDTECSMVPAACTTEGCSLLTGGVWEWTASDFRPYEGYRRDVPYKDYSYPWFEGRKVLRGGCWSSSPRMAYNTYRNFFIPERHDSFSGFRTCT